MIEEVIKLESLNFSVTHQDGDNVFVGSCRNQENNQKLSPKGAKVLYILVNKLNQTVSKQHLQVQVWGDYDFFICRSLDVYLTKIRAFLKPLGYQVVRDGVGLVRMTEIKP